MSDRDRKTLTRLAEAFHLLPEAKKERFLGYAEGVLDMSRHSAEKAAAAAVDAAEQESKSA